MCGFAALGVMGLERTKPNVPFVDKPAAFANGITKMESIWGIL